MGLKRCPMSAWDGRWDEGQTGLVMEYSVAGTENSEPGGIRWPGPNVYGWSLLRSTS